MLVTGTAPAAGVNEMGFVENALAPVRISNPAGGVTTKGVVRLAPCTVKLEEAEELPTLMTPNEPLKEEVVGMITGPLASIPFNTISSIRMVSVLVPVRVKRSFKPFICAAAGSDNVLARYQPVAAVVASLNKFAAVLAILTHAVPFQKSTANGACAVEDSFR